MNKLRAPVEPPKIRPELQSLRVVSPAFPTLAFATLTKTNAERHMNTLGIRVTYGANSSLITDDGVSAGTPEQRAADINAAFADPDVGAIICASGGATSHEVVPHLNADLIRQHPKPFFGRSDNLHIHAFLLTECAMISYAGVSFLPQFGEAEPFPETLQSWTAALLGDGSYDLVSSKSRTLGSRPWKELARRADDHQPRDRAGDDRWLRKGEATGRLIGGEVSVFRKVLTRSKMDVGDAILWVDAGDDDWGYLTQHLTGLLEMLDLTKIRGVIVADNPWLPFDKWERFIADMLLRHCVTGPLMIGGDSGHYNPVWTMPYGGRVTIDTAATTPVKVLR